jgi:hypothetical protein
MAAASPLSLTNEDTDFTQDVQRPENAPRTPGQGTPEDETLSDDDRSTVRAKNDRNQNGRNTSSQSARANNRGSVESLSLLNPSVYFNYRGINNQNFADPNGGSDEHIHTVDALVQYFSRYPSLRLKYTHFVYLKNLGVYPNNRLIIARRYAAPAPDNMFDSSGQGLFPIATVLSWMDPEQSLLQISFNERWEEATESLIDIFKDILSKDFGVSIPSSSPLPGFTAGIQYAITKALGITNAGADNIPQGNPNLIHETKRRRVPGDDIGGSGLESDFRIKMVCEYEQKYIGNIDPTIGYLDVIGNLLMMGTSNEQYLLTGAASGELAVLFNMAKEGRWMDLAVRIISSILEAVDKMIDQLAELVSTGSGDSDGDEGDGTYNNDLSEGGKEEGSTKSNMQGAFTAGLDILGTIGDSILTGIFSKYKEKLQGAIAAMGGLPNGPWHIMMGNPKNPFFVSGDMVCDKITIDFLPELAYNDLPLYYNATLEFSPARNHGMEGLGSKLNHGKGRIYGKPPKDIHSANGNPNQSRNNTQSNQRTSNGTSS